MVANELPSLDVLRRLFWMNGNTLCWKNRDYIPERRCGAAAGWLKRWRRTSYRQVKIGGVAYYAHRIAWALQTGVLPDTGLCIDHIDGNGLDNRLENLRLVDNQTNQRNSRMPKNNTSGSAGVYWDKARGKWRAQVKVDGRHKTLGSFESKDAAVAVRELAGFIHGYSDRHGKAA